MPIELIARASTFASHEAIVDPAGTFTYAALIDASAHVAAGLLGDAPDLEEARVAFLVPPGFDYVAVQWGIWRAGGVAVPLALSHPPAEIAHVLDDAEPAVVVVHPDLEARVRDATAHRPPHVLLTSDLLRGPSRSLPDIDESRRAMMVYTSGTTGKPKGVVTTHASIRAQITSLVEAWEWSPDDRILLVLPLHHVHGIVNVLLCALWSGACCEMRPRFDATDTWSQLVKRPLTLFMAVPTIYRRLVQAWEDASPDAQARMSAAARRLRLMVSGSAALPVATLERWSEITGHVLLERYGMTEFGMALANPLRGERVPGAVGSPLPGVDVRVVDEQMRDVPAGTPGEILVRSPGAFLEYWRQPEATARSLHRGWFVTGDVAVLDNGRYRIMGRRDLDIIKTGGYKVSALEIEDVLRTHPATRDCAVVGVADAEWGERVCVALEVEHGATISLQELQAWAANRLAPYKIPRALERVDELPRNALGKVKKADVTRFFDRS